MLQQDDLHLEIAPYSRFLPLRISIVKAFGYYRVDLRVLDDRQFEFVLEARVDFGWVESGFSNRARIVESGGIDSDSGGRINAEAMLLRVTRASCGRG